MIKSALKYVALISLIVSTTCGNWALDFDDDFAAAGAKKGVDPFTITFLTGTFPASITLGDPYTGPGDASLAEYDPGDGVWRTYTSKTITRLGDYIAFRGDWRTSDGNYLSLFNASFQSSAYTCDFSGAFTAYPNHNSAYREMFRNCTAVTAIQDNPVPVLTGAPGASMFSFMCRDMSGVTGALPAGFADTSGLTGTPAGSMFNNMCYGMSGVTGALPEGFADTSGLTGDPATAGFMFYQMCSGMSGVTGALPAGFANTSRLTGAPSTSMFYRMCTGMSGVTGSLPAGFADTSGLTGAPAINMFYQMCYGMSGVTGALPAGFANTSGLTGAPAGNMFSGMCNGMSGVTGGNLNIGTGITFTADNVDTLTRTFSGCTQWTGSVYWGDDLLTDQITPATRIYTFYNCTSKPNYSNLDDNWK